MSFRRNRSVMYISVAVMLACSPCYAAATSPFTQNNHHLSFNLGISDSLNKDYVGFGVGYRYFPLDGVDVGLDFNLLLGNSPVIYRVAPEVRYVFHSFKNFIPYVGVFYQYNYFVDLNDKGGLGARAGLYTPLSPGTYIGYGVSVGELRQCDKAEYGQCSTSEIELSLSLLF